ncbi:hypothetical protein ACEWY4_012282 [Coilia grayii]|uniref:Chromo domain-containing protein n=1 Tax=Coilia grayii TaxID=363190 RepID=A0ABD1K024_9TELE
MVPSVGFCCLFLYSPVMDFPDFSVIFSCFFTCFSSTINPLLLTLSCSLLPEPECMTEGQTREMQLDPAERPPELFQELVDGLNQRPTTPQGTQNPGMPPLPPAGHVVNPTPYSGSPEGCSGFLLPCSLALEMQAPRYTSDRARIAYIISLLSGRALQWAESIWNLNGPLTQSLERFTAHFREVFSLPTGDSSIQERLHNIRQGRSTISEYALRFRTLAAAKPGAAGEPPLPLLLDGGPVFAVNKILDSRRRRGRLEYLVDWEGYGPEERSWVPRDDILDPALLTTFHGERPDRPGPRSRGRPRRRGPRPSGAVPGGEGDVTSAPGSPLAAPGSPTATPTWNTNYSIPARSLSPDY